MMSIKKVIYIGENKSLLEKLSQVTLESIKIENIQLKELADGMVDESVVIIDSDIVSDYELLTLRHKELKGSEKIFYNAVEPLATMSKQMLISAGICVLQEDVAIENKVEKIFEEITLIEKKDNLFVFYGADRKVGTSMVAQTIAHILRSRPDINVAYVDCSGYVSENYILQKAKKDLLGSGMYGIEALKIKIQNDLLDIQELKSAMIQEDNLWFLPGVANFLEVRHFSVQMIRELLKLCKENFDVVIVDSGSPSDTTLNLAPLMVAKNKFLVTTDSLVALKNYRAFAKEVLTPLNADEEFTLILNDVSVDSEGIYATIQQNYQIKSLITGLLRETESITEEDLIYRVTANRDYKNNSKKIANVIFEFLGYEKEEIQAKKKSFFNR